MQSDAKTVPAYLRELPDDRRAAVARLRAMIRKASPRVTEAMTYGMPTFFFAGEPAVAVASQKQYVALYIDVGVLKAARKSLKGLSGIDCGKCCIRFRRVAEIPYATVEAILRAAAAKIGATTRKQNKVQASP